jgi:phosphinothricin acetyltransferase
MLVRLATAADAPALARVYNQGIEERTATFETTPRSDHDVLGWFDGVHPIVVVVDEPKQDVLAFARASEYRARECYRGVFEFAVYTDRDARRRGAGLLAMRELITRARQAGAWKLLSRVFVENEASRKLLAAVGFREVGTYYRHAKLDGRWRDVVIVEKFLAPIGAIKSVAPGGARGSRGDVLDSLRTKNVDAAALAQSLDWARAMLDAFGRPDSDLLDAVADAFFQTRAQPGTLRAQFVDLFRAYAALSAEALREIHALFSTRVGRIPLASDLDAFYEALFVWKQIARGSDEALAPHVEILIAWMRQAIGLPTGLRGRISAGNVTSLLMTLATSSGPTNEQRHVIAELAVYAKLRHRVDAPAALHRPSSPPPTPSSLPAPPETPRRRSVPPPLPQQRPKPAPVDVGEEEVPTPLSSQDFLPDSLRVAISTPAVAFKPVSVPVIVPPPESSPVSEAAPVTAEGPASKPKRSRRTKKEGEGTKKKAARGRAKKAKPDETG